MVFLFIYTYYIQLHTYIYIYIYYIYIFIYVYIQMQTQLVRISSWHTFIYIYTYMCICIIRYIYANKQIPVKAIVRIAHPWSGDGQQTFLTPSGDNQTRNYDRVLKPLYLSINIRVNERSILRRYSALSFLRLHSFIFLK